MRLLNGHQLGRAARPQQFLMSVRFGMKKATRRWPLLFFAVIIWLASGLFDSPIETCSRWLFLYSQEFPIVPEHPDLADVIAGHVLADPLYRLLVRHLFVLAHVDDGELHAILAGY